MDHTNSLSVHSASNQAVGIGEFAYLSVVVPLNFPTTPPKWSDREVEGHRAGTSEDLDLSSSETFELQQFFPLSSWILFMISAATSS
ncbi:cmgc dyrk dyrk2 protein kinase [Moniliophthora roreri]|nr:cmgc dyrk dyrk2 protein kinase [Moniliophthora roreri]